MQPVPPPTTDSHADDSRIARVQASIEPLRGTLLERMHWVNADEPEECTWGMIDMVGLLGQAPIACMPTWGGFLRSVDMSPAFQRYRQVIQLLTWQHPVEPGGRLVLKAPQTSNNIAEFAEVFPEAHFVITDRDPYRVLSSTMVMVASLMDAFCVVNPVREPGPEPYDWLSTTETRLANLARFDEEHPDRTTHVAYPSLAASPRETVVELVEQLGVPAASGFGGQIDRFIEAQRSGGPRWLRPDGSTRLGSVSLMSGHAPASPRTASGSASCPSSNESPECDRRRCRSARTAPLSRSRRSAHP